MPREFFQQILMQNARFPSNDPKAPLRNFSKLYFGVWIPNNILEFKMFRGILKSLFFFSDMPATHKDFGGKIAKR